MLLPACSPAGEEAERGNRTAPAREASRPTDAVISPTAAGAGVAEQVAAKRRTLIAEAVEALQETESALGLLAAGKTDQARAALARATGKLEVVLAADPDLALAPVDVQATVHDVVIGPVEAEAVRRQAEEALDQGRLQDARRMIAELASEHVISVTNIPLATYPLALKQAAALIHAGRTGEAVATLETALGTLVIERTIIPLPLLRAEALLDEARPLAEKPQRSGAENDRLRRLLAAARRQIELARALGYATSKDTDALFEELTTIERRTEGQGSGAGLFDRIKALFAKGNRESNKAPEAQN
jgi:predicted MarR family transcription regulator